MNEKKYIRQVQTSVTNFLYCGDDYLFVKRNKTRRVDPGRLNGIGGRLEKGEDFLSAAIRETKEETGYIVTSSDITFSGIINIEGGYQEDWIISFFKIRVHDKTIPIGKYNHEGDFLWIPKDEVLDSKHELVDDLHYCFNDIVDGKEILFMNAQLNENQKIENIKISKLPRLT